MIRNSGKPVVGIVADLHTGGAHAQHGVHDKYLDAVTAGAGAIAFILPALIDRPGGAWGDPADLEAALDRLDGVFLTGAPSNIGTQHYGGGEHVGPADPARDAVSLRLVRAAVARGLPIFGVCRGLQELNVALGGTLHRRVHEVPGLADHREAKDAPVEVQYGPSHEVAFATGGLIAAVTGVRGARVNSLHGQGIDRLAPGLVAEARAPDGLVEAVALPDRPFVLGVQWHPEWRFRDDPVSTALFAAFGRALRGERVVATRGEAA